MLKIISETTGEEIRPGDTVTDFRGDEAVIIAATRARSFGKSGKVSVSWGGANGEGEYYDKVFNLSVIEV